MTDQSNAELLLLEPSMIKRSLYITTLDSLHFHTNDIQSFFANRSNIELGEELDQLINDVSAVLSSDIGEIKPFLAAEAKAERINSNGICFEDFMKLLQLWLEGKTGRKLPVLGSKSDLTEDTTPKNEANLISMGNRTNTARKIVIKSPENSELPPNNQTVEASKNSPIKDLPQNYQGNKDKLNQLLTKHEKNFSWNL